MALTPYLKKEHHEFPGSTPKGTLGRLALLNHTNQAEQEDSQC